MDVPSKYKEPPFKRLDLVQKKGGYRWPGVVVSVYQSLSGEWRVVVECTVPEIAGAQHIFNPEQIERR